VAGFEEVTAVTTPSSRDPERRRHLTIAELVAARGITPISSVDELAEPGAFESDEEVEDFLADLYASRRVSIG